MAELLNIGVSGLTSYQRALTTVSHNITNANTAGYTRQLTDLAAQAPQFTGAGFEGTGVQVSAIKRSYNNFLEDQVTRNLTAFKQQEALSSLSADLDNFLADPDIGVAPILQNFFTSLQDLSTDPSSTPTRQVLLSDANSLTAIFNSSYDRLQNLKNGVNVEVSSSVSEINSFSKAIADINKDILVASGGGRFPPNDLLDQRQNLLNKLAEKISVTSFEQDDGTLNVFVGGGQSLVVGTQYQALSVVNSEYDRTVSNIAISQGATNIDITDQISGGKLGGVINFRTDVLNPAYNQLGRIAVSLSGNINSQNQLGLTLGNTMGGNFFTDLTSSTSISSTSNATATDYLFTSTISDTNLLKSSEYRLDYSSASGGTYTMTRLSDNTTVGTSTNLATLSSTVSASEGFSFSLTSGTSITNGDKFRISPVVNAARDISVSITNTNDIATASPLVFSGQATNSGDVLFNNDGLISKSGSTIPGTPITFTFNSTTNVFAISTGGTIAYDPATDGGTQYQLTVAGLGSYQFTVSGTPSNGDVISLGSNAGGTGDNRNVLKILGTQSQKLLGGSTASFQEAYAQLVADVGVKAKRAEFSSQANQVLYERAVASQQATSGVNLDEEAADLIRYQQAYQAVARVISTADEIFQVLLGAVSR